MIGLSGGKAWKGPISKGVGLRKERSLTDAFDSYIEDCLHLEVFVRADKAHKRDHSSSLGVNADQHILCPCQEATQQTTVFRQSETCRKSWYPKRRVPVNSFGMSTAKKEAL